MSAKFEGNVGLSPYYLNTRRLEALSSIEIPVSAQASLNKNSAERVTAMRYALSVAKALVNSGHIPNLVRAYAEIPDTTRLLAWIWGSFSFKGSRLAFEREAEGGSVQPATFSGTINLGDRDYRAQGELINEHYYSQSSIGTLSGKRNLFILGMFDFQDENIEIFPYIIADIVDEMSPFINLSIRNSIRIYPDQIDSFKKITGTPRGGQSDIRKLQTTSESNVKNAISDIIGEPFIPKDWGGEVSDLQTNNLVVEGVTRSAAFILKGPALSGEMHPGNMGKRGDQLVRAFGEPVDLVIIQHCNKIANTVVKMAEALAIDPRNPKRFCIIDGADTARLLKAYGKL